MQKKLFSFSAAALASLTFLYTYWLYILSDKLPSDLFRKGLMLAFMPSTCFSSKSIMTCCITFLHLTPQCLNPFVFGCLFFIQWDMAFEGCLLTFNSFLYLTACCCLLQMQSAFSLKIRWLWRSALFKVFSCSFINHYVFCLSLYCAVLKYLATS